MEYNANELMLACEADDFDKACDLIGKGKPSITATDSRGRNALHYCATNATSDIADLLLQKKKTLLKSKDKYDVQPLHLAVITGNEALLDLFLNYKVDLNVTDKDGHTVIHLAVANGHAELIDYLLLKGAKLNRPDKENAFALHYAVQLCATESSSNEKSPTKPKSKKAQRYETAVDNGNRGMEVLMKLLSKDVDDDCRDKHQRTPLIWAAASGLKDICEVLLDNGATLNISDKDGMNALHAAVSRNQSDMIGYLVKKGLNVDTPDKNGCSPIFYAVALGLPNAAENLFRYGANANHKDNKGRTPAHCAAAAGSLQLLTMILHNNGKLWVQNEKGDTPAHEASLCKQNQTVRFLLDQADDPDNVNMQNNENATCLHLAAITNNVDLCRILLSFNARKDIMMNHRAKEISAQEAAGLKFNQDVVDVLQNVASGAPYTSTGGGGGGGEGAAGAGAKKAGKKDKGDKKKKKKK